MSVSVHIVYLELLQKMFLNISTIIYQEKLAWWNTAYYRLFSNNKVVK